MRLTAIIVVWFRRRLQQQFLAAFRRSHGLPSFNYYLHFALTCHLSLLLLSQADKNKMDSHNLAIFIGSCLRLERWLFNYQSPANNGEEETGRL